MKLHKNPQSADYKITTFSVVFQRITYSEAGTIFVSIKFIRSTFFVYFPLEYSGGIMFDKITTSFSKYRIYNRNVFSSEVFNGTGTKNISENSALIVLAGYSPIRHNLLNISPFNSLRMNIGASTE